MTKINPLTEEGLAKKCDWWWRQSFAQSQQESIAAMAAVLQQFKASPDGRALADLAGVPAQTLSPVASPSVPLSRKTVQQAQGAVSAMLEEQWVYSAWRYEVGCRVNGKYEFGKPWIKLSIKRKAQLAERWPDPVESPSGGYVRILRQRDAKARRNGWTPPVMMSWNLNLENNQLAEGFREMIGRMREAQGIPNPQPNKGKRRRPFGWRDVELMDIQKYKLRPLDNSESSQVSKARAEFETKV